MEIKTHEKLRERMRERGYTAYKLAKELGISKSTMSLKLNGVFDFKWQEVVDISRILGLKNPYNWFMYEGERS